MEAVIDVVIPTFNPGERLIRILEQMEAQTVRPRRVRIINTNRSGMEALLQKKGLSEADLRRRFPFLTLEHIAAEEFDHGGTRNRGFRACEGADYVLSMTQDALPADIFLVERLLAALRGTPAGADSRRNPCGAPLQCESAPQGKVPGAAAQETMPAGVIAVAYARQLPNGNAPTDERISRRFNYPELSLTKNLEDLPDLGVKTYFCSNVCAMYRMDVWRSLSGFPDRAIFNEDMVYAGKALQAGYRTRYEAGALVYHSHRYNARQQFHRNFDLGVSQAQNPQIFEGVSSEGEGMTYAKEVLRELRRRHEMVRIPGFVWRSGWRLIGYRLGKAYEKLPRSLVVRCSSNRNFWGQ